jgi:hypothetical protein
MSHHFDTITCIAGKQRIDAGSLHIMCALLITSPFSLSQPAL